MSRKIFHRSASALIALLLALITVLPAAAAPPNNDNFADAQLVLTLPLNAVADSTEATSEPGEPQVCWFMDRTVWYSFTPAQNMTVHVNSFGTTVDTNINLYRATGPGFSGLAHMGCSYFGSSPAFLLEAGQTYYIQAGALFGEIGNIQVNVEEFTPEPPQGGLYYYPSDPSPFDMVNFCDSSYDSSGFGFNAFTWDFGDGATSTMNCASHQFAADGDYTVQHTATTIDGRIASYSQVLHVRTHDVAISRISAPQSASSGQTRTITVSVSNKRYTDTVRIELYKSTTGGFQLVGWYSQSVPARSGNRTSEFSFNYTFTSSDASLGKVTFKAVAVIEGVRDAFPTDNEAYSTPPTKVLR